MKTFTLQTLAWVWHPELNPFSVLGLWLIVATRTVPPMVGGDIVLTLEVLFAGLIPLVAHAYRGVPR